MMYYRVTDILAPFSGILKIDPTVLKLAAERGSFVHAVFDAKQNDMGHPAIPEEWSGYFSSIDQWKEGKDFLPKPERWFCNKYQFTGECDGIYRDEDGLVLFDLKTSASEGSTWFLQGSAYAYLARKAGLDIKKIEFVRLKKDGKKPCLYHYEEDFDLFLCCLKTYEKFFKPKISFDEKNPLDMI